MPAPDHNDARIVCKYQYQSGAATEGRPYKLMEIIDDHQFSNTEL